jgi:hypothetical protein
MNARAFFLGQILGLSLVIAVSAGWAAEFHVTNSDGLRLALEDAQTNGEHDTIYLAAGTYAPHPWSSFYYASEESRSLIIRGEPGTSPEEVILDGGDDRQILYMDDNYPDWLGDSALLPEFALIGLSFTRAGDPYDNAVRIHGYQAHVTVQNCRFYDNASYLGKGGAITIDSPCGNVIFENNLVEGNILYEREVTTGTREEPRRETHCMGGGVYIHCSGEFITMRNNVIVNNQAVGDYGIGGGVYLSGSCPPFIAFNIINNTIADNTAGFMAGGLFIRHWAAAPANLYNNIIYGNEAPDNPVTNDFWADVLGAAEIYAVHNDMSLDPGVVGLFDPPTGSFGNLDSDPNFLAGTYFPDVGSPVIDAGNSLPPPPGLPETDFLGSPRVCGTAPDLGAYELCGGGWPRPPRPMISLGSRSLVMVAKKKMLLPLKIALLPPLVGPNDPQVDANVWPISLAEETNGDQVEWWIFLKKAGGAGIPANSWYLGSNGWTGQAAPYGVAPASKYLLQETEIGTLCPADLGLKNGVYELWFGVDQEVDGKINPSSFTSRGMYLKVDGNQQNLRPVPGRPEWAGYPAILNQGAKLNK